MEEDATLNQHRTRKALQEFQGKKFTAWTNRDTHWPGHYIDTVFVEISQFRAKKFALVIESFESIFLWSDLMYVEISWWKSFKLSRVNWKCF